MSSATDPNNDSLKDLILHGNLEEAQYLISQLENQNKYSSAQKLHFYYLQGLYFLHKGDYKEVLDMEPQFVGSELKNEQLFFQIDVLILFCTAERNLGMLDQAEKKIPQMEQLLTEVDEHSETKERYHGKITNLKCAILFEKGEISVILPMIEQNITLLTKENDLVEKSFALNLLGTYHTYYGDSNLAIQYLNDGLQLRKELDLKIETGSSLFSIGTYYQNKGDFKTAYKYYEESLAIYINLDHKPEIANLFNNIGNVWKQLGDLNKASDYLQRSLALRQVIGNKIDTAMTLNNLGIVYRRRGDINTALLHYNNSLVLFEQTGNKRLIAAILNNISSIYAQKGDLDKALETLEKSLDLKKQLGNKQSIAATLENIGVIYREKGDLQRAFDYFLQCVSIWEQTQHYQYLAEVLFNIVSLAIDMNSLMLATQYFEKLQVVGQKENTKTTKLYLELSEAILLKLKTEIPQEMRFKPLKTFITGHVAAQALLENIINSKQVIDHEIVVEAIFNLCEFLLAELQILQNESIMKDITQLVDKLQTIATAQESAILLMQTFILKAKLHLVDQQVPQAKIFLQKAHQLAIEKNYDNHALIIMTELKKLENSLPEWLMAEESTLVNRVNDLELKNLFIALRQGRVDVFNVVDLGHQTPQMADLQAFAEKLSKRKVEW